MNTAALAIAGVDAVTPDPEDGRIERDEAGRPAGALHDGAMRNVHDTNDLLVMWSISRRWNR